MNPKKVLIVEDDLVIATDIRRMLKKHHWHTVAICTHAQEALANIEAFSPDLVLIDINLRGRREGITVGKHLLQNDAIPYIYITSFSDSHTLEEAKKTRPLGYIVKPFREKDIIAAIKIAMGNHQQPTGASPAKAERREDIPFKLRKVVAYIDDNLDKALAVQDLAALTDWNSNHFIRNFKKYLGTTPYQYMLRQKIGKAKALLSGSDRPIADIARQLGFGSHSSFSTAFHKITQLTAEDYRRKSRGALQ